MKKYDVVALSAACVDINILAEESHIDAHGLKKGLTNSIPSEKLSALMKGKEILTKTPGSPGANVVMGIALRGGSAALIGKIANDPHGNFFTGRIRSHGIDYTPVVYDNAEATTTCVLVLTTPDRERTFAFSGNSGLHLSPEDIDRQLLEQAKITYCDSYLWLSTSGKEAVHHAADEAKKSGSKVALALNDADIVARNQPEILALAKSHAHILVGSQNEFMTLLNTETLEDTIAALSALGCTAAMTAGSAGAYIIEDGKSVHVPARKVEKIVDTNGAGDQFAAGFLYGLAQGKSAKESGEIGTHWAADIIQHSGSEPKIGKNAAPSL